MSSLRTFWKLWWFHFRGTPKQVLSRFTWELWQTLVGFWVAGTIALRFKVDSIAVYDGAIVLSLKMGKPFWGGISFGTVILGDVRIAPEVNNTLFMHEFGHCLQSRAAGPLYLFKYGLPSLRSAMSKGVHYLHPAEQDANMRALRYFSQRPGFAHWKQESNPILAGSRIIPIKWWEYLPLVYPVYHLFFAFKSQRMRRPSPNDGLN